MAKNTKQQEKKQKKQLKIAKKWPKYHLDHENYSPKITIICHIPNI